MAARTGMGPIILRLRAMCNAGTAEHTIGAVDFFTDTHLQDALDQHVSMVRDELLAWLPETVAGGVLEYHDAKAHWRDYETADSGTIYWAIRDGTGALQGTAGYTADYLVGVIRFAADQGGSAYYLTARSYDLNSAAADVWQQRQAFYSDWYQFDSDGQRFSRQQAFEHAVIMEKQFRARAGQNRQRGDLRTGLFVRTDLRATRPGDDNPHPNRPGTARGEE